MVTKPDYVFDRTRDWEGLAGFVAYGPSSHLGPQATLGVVSGRRRQGKSFLLRALAEATGGMYFAATEATQAESLRLFARALDEYAGSSEPSRFEDWNEAVSTLFETFRERPVPVIIDEFPFLSKSAPSLPSIIQRELGPGGTGQRSAARLVLCGSAMSVMGRLLSGQAPLRGRAGLELVVQPFRYRDAAAFWGITDPRLAVLVHSVVGGTPAYRREFVQADAPEGLADFDSWVIRTVLNSQMPLFREARYLLAEESDIRDPAIYQSVLAAIAAGKQTNGGIAKYIGRSADQLTHPLNVLEDCGLVVREPDLFRSGRARYRIVEPLITFYQAVMRRRWSELEAGRAATVWEATYPTYTAQVLGPHFEGLCRQFALHADLDVFGGLPGEVGSGVINDSELRTQIEIDVAVLDAQQPDRPRRIMSLGEAKWGEVMGVPHVERLARARDLLERKGYDTGETVLACYSAAGFDDDLRAMAEDDYRVTLIDLNRLYGLE